MGRWDPWLGRTETRVDRVDEARLARWLATFDRTAPDDGTVPEGFHWCLCTPDEATAKLGLDGHPARNGTVASFLPPLPLPRRMWASSRMDFHRPLRVGEPVERHSRINSITAKTGNSGQLIFVEVEHRFTGSAGLAVHELQSIVYREWASGKEPTLAPRHPGEHPLKETVRSGRTIRPSEALLFRYSALTFNAHRIHYDKPYAVGEEGYAGVVVQGPLTATLLLDLARREFGDNALESFAFRGVSAAIAGDDLLLSLVVTGSDLVFSASTGEGLLVMSARGTKRTGGHAG